MERYHIAAGSLGVTVRARGAELTSISHTIAGEVLWQAGPAWPRQSPVLFPIVGALANDEYRHEGRTYKLGRHGFARDLDFTWTETAADACALKLEDDERTRVAYPFRFRLDIRYAIDGESLIVTYVVGNPGSETLPVSLGAHPAFRWPLKDGVAKEAHQLTFAQNEPEPIRRLEGGLLAPQPFPSPIRGRELALDPSLFDADAIVMDQPNSTSVRYSAPDAPALDVSWSGFAQLGLWSKEGGEFLCIEPWYGYASPTAFSGDFVEKPGLMHLAPGDSRTCAMRISVTEYDARNRFMLEEPCDSHLGNARMSVRDGTDQLATSARLISRGLP
jgi:galactose mutarotase-like enzyme